jgi:hypothetical protein
MPQRVLVQAGHQRPLQPGHEGQTGAPGEADLVARIQRRLVQLLNQDGNFSGIPMPGRINDGVAVDAALFLHADGAANPTASGFSVGFPNFDVNRKLAQLIAEEIAAIPGAPRRRPDNNTVDMAQYYGFSHVATPGPEVLVEHGFVTNPDERVWLNDHVDDIAHAELNALRRFFGLEPSRDLQGGGGSQKVRVGSPLLAASRAPAQRVTRHLLSLEHGDYAEEDVRRVCQLYYRTARSVGLDPLVVIAQMYLETGHLTSFWSQRPRRNMAGIGVTGEPGVGLSFPTLPLAVRAHVGRLLAYAIPAGAESLGQRRLINEALAVRPLPASLRGAAPTLKGLAGTWAADPDYARKIAGVANRIRRDE